MENINNQHVVAYAADGTPLDLESYKVKLEKGSADIKQGKYLTDDELLKEMKNW